ncbi:MAG: hypothetical protein CL927_12395 [Deltaproteobacteria bacterium]|nr:hypothetical protein [Deltaproteobacteria bacterium]HCH64352.1 hypothetical protein [Deltaproteobacteria bacterium]
MNVPVLLALIGFGSGAPSPDYRAELGARYAAEVRRLGSSGQLEAAMKRAAEVEAQVGPFVQVRYEAALARNQAGAIRAAIEAYGQVLALDPDHVGALYDRGELLLVAGTTADRVTARRDLEHAEALRPDHWAVPYRLALLAAQDQDSIEMANALTRALRNGLELGLIGTDPAWDPILRGDRTGPALMRFVRTYGSDDLVNELEQRTGTSP